MKPQEASRLPLVVLVQSPMPGVTPYAGGRHLWADTLHHLDAGRRHALLDLRFDQIPGSPGGPSLDHTVQALADDIAALDAGPVHLVGHDFAGLVALLFALRHPQHLACASIVASTWAAPSGDGVDNLTFLSPPPPLWSAASQRWALERLSHSHQHVSAQVVAACVEAAGTPAHQAMASLQGDGFSKRFMAQVMRAKFGFYQAARGDGVTVPVQVIAGTHDPLAPGEQMLALFRVLAEHQRRTQFHLVNRSGSLIFREQPQEFYRLVAAFSERLAAGG